MDYFSGLHFPNSSGQKIWRGSKDAFPIYCGIQYIHSGALAVRVAHEKWFYATGPVAFLTCPDHHYEYHSPGGESREQYWVCFHGRRTEEYRARGLFAPDPKSPLIFPENPESFFIQMQDLIVASNSGNYNRAVWLLEGALLALSDPHSAPAMGNRHLARLDALCRKIATAPELPRDFAAEAGSMSITLNHFNRLFRKFYLDSPRQYLIRCRLRKAALKLVSTNLSIAEVAAECGFADEFYFSRQFHLKYLHSPREYRNDFRITRHPEPEPQPTRPPNPRRAPDRRDARGDAD